MRLLAPLVLGLLALAMVVLGEMNTYIVMFDSTVTEADVDAAVAALEQNGGVIVHRYSKVLRGFAAQIPEAYVAILSADPRAIVEADGVVNIVRGPAMATTASLENEHKGRRSHSMTAAEERQELARAHRLATRSEAEAEARHHHGGK
jgi:hypothetical protein